jgi:hypothetical protein
MATAKRKITLRSIRIGPFRKWLEAHPRMQFTTCDGKMCPLARYTGGRVPGTVFLREKSAAPWVIAFVRSVDNEAPGQQIVLSGKTALAILNMVA